MPRWSVEDCNADKGDCHCGAEPHVIAMAFHRAGRSTCLALLSAATFAMVSSSGAAKPPTVQHVKFEESYRKKLNVFIRQLRATPHAVPGTAVVVVHGDRTVFEKAYGVRNLATRAPMTLDTPVYNASVTKAYTGLLAAILDVDGTLPLSATLIDVWPEITLPKPLDPRSVSVSKLLSHSSGIRAGGLNFRSVWTGQVQMSDVPKHLARFATPQRAGFVYDNLGPFIWSAMAYTRTGLHWPDLLRQRVLTPLGLSRTSARLEDFSSDEVARCHPRVRGAWRSIPPKPTPVLNAAGGMYASARDEATFLKAFITDGESSNGRILGAALRRTWQKESEQDRNMWGFHRDGYGLGWDLGTITGYRFVSRSGGYPGCRAISMFFPAHKLGVVVMSNGDAAANTYNSAILAQAVDAWTDPSNASRRAQGRITMTHQAMANAVGDADAGDARLSRARVTDPRVATDALGHYRSERLGNFEIATHNGEMIVTGGVFSAPLRHLGGDSFVILAAFGTAVETLDLIRDRSGRVSGFMWDDDRFDRVTA